MLNVQENAAAPSGGLVPGNRIMDDLDLRGIQTITLGPIVNPRSVSLGVIFGDFIIPEQQGVSSPAAEVAENATAAGINGVISFDSVALQDRR